jgi:hypothetical protein
MRTLFYRIRLTGNAGRALISDQAMNNRQVASAGQAALVAMRQNEERRLTSLHRSAVSQNRMADEIARNTKWRV